MSERFGAAWSDTTVHLALADLAAENAELKTQLAQLQDSVNALLSAQNVST